MYTQPSISACSLDSQKQVRNVGYSLQDLSSEQKGGGNKQEERKIRDLRLEKKHAILIVESFSRNGERVKQLYGEGVGTH
jgi:hypothetical protein